MQLFVTSYGAFIGKKSERLIVKEKGQVTGEYPFFELEHVIIDSLGVSISADAIHECMEHGVPISFMTPTGNPYAKLIPANLTGTVVTRREQLFAYKDRRGLELVKAFIHAKLANQVSTVKYFAKYRKASDLKSYDELMALVRDIEGELAALAKITGDSIDAVRGQLMSAEGRAGNSYWECVKILTSGSVAFPGREHRGASDPLNALLNYGYAILAHQVENSLTLAGLDPFGGFLHVDRPGKKSLVYDFMEEFRQVAVDRVAIAMVNKGTAIEMEDAQLSLAARRALAEKITERLDAPERFGGKKQKLKTIIQLQARRIATFLRGEAKYKPFIAGW